MENEKHMDLSAYENQIDVEKIRTLLLNVLKDEKGEINAEKKYITDIVITAFSQYTDIKKQCEDLNKELEIFKEEENFIKHSIKQLYNSGSIEQAIYNMEQLSSSVLNANTRVYCASSLEGKLFTVNSDMEREYINPEKNSIIRDVVLSEEPYINNNPSDIVICNSAEEKKAENIMVVPLSTINDGVIGVVVCTNKDGGFKEKDMERFNLENGNIGNTFAVCLESRMNEELAMTDKLTRLYNRQGLENCLKQDIYPNRHDPTSIIMLDIDHFKNFNDNYGHDTGDKCLAEVAKTLKNGTRKGDNNVFRWGGEEMVVIVKANESEAFEIADRIRRNIEQLQIHTKEGSIGVTASFGVSQIDSYELSVAQKNTIGESFEKWIKKADENLYMAKNNGRNCVCASKETNLEKGIDFDMSETHNKEDQITKRTINRKVELPFNLE